MSQLPYSGSNIDKNNKDKEEAMTNKAVDDLKKILILGLEQILKAMKKNLKVN